MATTWGMILSAGLGTRLKPLTLFRPKPIMELAGKPIIYFLIKMLERAGIKDIILNLHHQPELIKEFIEKTAFLARIHLVYETNILGTAGGVSNALKLLKIENQGLVVIHGDILCDIDLAPFLDTAEFCSLIGESDRLIGEYLGSVGVDSKGLITELGQFYQSKDQTNNKGFFTGIQFLSPQAVELLKTCRSESLVAHVYPKWLKESRLVTGVLMPLDYEDLGSPQRIFDANMSIVKNPSRFSHIDFLEGFTQSSPNIYLGPGVIIDKSAKLFGPLMIAQNARIGCKASLGPNVIIGERCVVDDGAVIKNSVVMSDTVIEKMASIDCAIALSSARVVVRG